MPSGPSWLGTVSCTGGYCAFTTKYARTAECRAVCRHPLCRAMAGLGTVSCSVVTFSGRSCRRTTYWLPSTCLRDLTLEVC